MCFRFVFFVFSFYIFCVFFILFPPKQIYWDKIELHFIFELKKLNHDNLTTFMGICYNDGDK